MATDRDRATRSRDSPCPFGCGAEVHADARYCPECGKKVVEFCPECGGRIRRPRGDRVCPGCGARPTTATVVGGSTPPNIEGRCKICTAALDLDTKHCPDCNALTKPFKRLCPSCKKEAGLTDNKCPHCGIHFVYSLDTGHKVFRYIVCQNCGRESEFDDWMALRGILCVFQTEPGAKIASLPPDERAAQFVQHYFGEDDLRAYLSGADEAPWDFPTNELLLEFLHNFSCVCKARAWTLSAARGMWKHAKPHVTRTGQTVGSTLWKGIVDITTMINDRLNKGRR